MKNRLTFFEKLKIKTQLFFLNVFGERNQAKMFRKRLMAAEDMTLSQGSQSFGLYGLPDFEYDSVYSQLYIDSKYKFIWLNNISGGINYEGGGILYIHNDFKGSLYAPNCCVYIRKSVYGLIEAENSKIIVRGNNTGYIHNPFGEVQIGGVNYGYIYVKNGRYFVLKDNSGISKGKEMVLKPLQKKLLLGLTAEDR